MLGQIFRNWSLSRKALFGAIALVGSRDIAGLIHLLLRKMVVQQDSFVRRRGRQCLRLTFIVLSVYCFGCGVVPAWKIVYLIIN